MAIIKLFCANAGGRFRATNEISFFSFVAVSRTLIARSSHIGQRGTNGRRETDVFDDSLEIESKIQSIPIVTWYEIIGSRNVWNDGQRYEKIGTDEWYPLVRDEAISRSLAGRYVGTDKLQQTWKIPANVKENFVATKKGSGEWQTLLTAQCLHLPESSNRKDRGFHGECLRKCCNEMRSGKDGQTLWQDDCVWSRVSQDLPLAISGFTRGGRGDSSSIRD